MLTPRTDRSGIAASHVVGANSRRGGGSVGRNAWGRGASRGHRLARPYDPLRGTASLSDPTDEVFQSGASSAGAELDFDDDPRLGRMRAEAVLLLAKTPLSTRKLAQLAGLADGTEARTMIRGLNQTYEEQGRALRIEKIAGGHRMVTRPGLAPWLRRLGHVPPALRLSPPTLETLAVVAYRQPVSRADTEAVRGVACGELLRQLMEKDLIRMTGRSEELGRPYLYGTTKRFLQLFGLTGTDALPSIDWQAVQEDQTPDLMAAEAADENTEDADASIDSTSRDSTTSPKESVVSTALVSPPMTSDRHALASQAGDLETDDVVEADVVLAGATSTQSPAAVIEDEEDDLYEGVTDADDDDEEIIDDDEFSDDWDDDDDDDVEDDESDEDDLDDDSDDDDSDDEDESDDWEEVGDDDDDLDEGDDDDDDWDDDDESSDDDEDWSE